MKSARAGMFEYQLEALFRYETARQGAKAQAYLPIVGTGVNGAYLHYTRNDTQIKQGDLILIDAACEADGYGSDVTRTFPVNGKFSAEQATIYNLVLDMQNVSAKKEEKKRRVHPLFGCLSPSEADRVKLLRQHTLRILILISR